MAAKSSMDEEHAVPLMNMSNSPEPSMGRPDPGASEPCDQVMTPAFMILISQSPLDSPIKLETFVIKYSEDGECAIPSETLDLADPSRLASLFTTAHTTCSKFHAVVNWNGKTLSIMPRQDVTGVFTTSINGSATSEGSITILRTGDVISCCKQAQPLGEVHVDRSITVEVTVEETADNDWKKIRRIRLMLTFALLVLASAAMVTGLLIGLLPYISRTHRDPTPTPS